MVVDVSQRCSAQLMQENKMLRELPLINSNNLAVVFLSVFKTRV